MAKPIKPPADEKYLSPEDLFRLEMAQMRLQNAVAEQRVHRAEDKLDEAVAGFEQMQLQVKAHEITISRLRKQAALESKLGHLNNQIDAMTRTYGDLRIELSQRYAVDLARVAYDDVTGRISLLPDTKE